MPKLRSRLSWGELFAGILLGPYALGSVIAINGSPVIQINDFVRAFGEIGGILILFAAGLEMTFSDFRHVGSASFVTGTVGVIVPFFMGYGISVLLGFDAVTSMVVAAALVATSISITSLVLMELKQSRTKESRVMIGAAVVALRQYSLFLPSVVILLCSWLLQHRLFFRCIFLEHLP